MRQREGGGGGMEEKKLKKRKKKGIYIYIGGEWDNCVVGEDEGVQIPVIR